MDIKDIFKDSKNLTEYQLENSFDRALRLNPSFRYLSQENQDLILDLVTKYKVKLRKGLKISAYNIRQDCYRLHRDRLKLNLTLRDLKAIKEILNAFKND